MSLTVIQVTKNKQISKKDGGTYPGTELVLQAPDGQIMVKALHKTIVDGNKGLSEAIDTLKSGDVIQLITEKSKDGKYNNVKSIVKAGSGDDTQSMSSGPTAKAEVKSTYTPKASYDNTGMQVGNALNVAGALLSGKKEATVETLEATAVAVLKLSNSLKARLEAGEFNYHPSVEKSKFDDLDI